MSAVPVEAATDREAELACRIAQAAPERADDAEAELYRRLAPRVRRYGLRHLRDAHAAADLMQQVMVLTIEQLRGGQLREPQRVTSFVFGACRMTVLDMRRGSERREALLQRHGDDMLAIADIAVAPRHDHERVAECLERLTERQRSVIVQCFYEDKPSDEVAGALGLSAGNVRVIPPQHRATARLPRRAAKRVMSIATCAAPIAFDALVEYWLGDTDEATTHAIDEHLLGCDACSAQLDEVIALGRGVRAAFDNGLVGACVGAGFVDRLAARGMRVREYRVPRNGSVECSVAPDDALVVSRLQAPLAGVTRLDVVTRSSLFGGEQRRQDVPFDSSSGELVLAPNLSVLRRLPASRFELRLMAVGADGERLIGHYTLNHSPWPAGESSRA